MNEMKTNECKNSNSHTEPEYLRIWTRVSSDNTFEKLEFRTPGDNL